MSDLELDAGLGFDIGGRRYFRVSELAKVAGVTRQNLHIKILRRGIQPIRIGKLFLVDEQAAKRLLAA